MRIETAVVRQAAQRLAARGDWLLVEGAGGWHAPIGEHGTMAELAIGLGLPVLLVVGLRLGGLNHARLTRDAIRRDGLPFAGWIGNAVDPAMTHLGENVAYLSRPFGEPSALVAWRAPDNPSDRADPARRRRGAGCNSSRPKCASSVSR